MKGAFALDARGFGALYGGATLLGAVGLPWAGRLLDRVGMRTFATTTALALALGCAVTGVASHWAVLLLGFALLRFLGQGVMVMMASTTVIRELPAARGRAHGVVSLGQHAGEALIALPLAAVLALHGWRAGWALLAIMLAVVYIPLVRWLVPVRGWAPPAARAKSSGQSLHEVLRDRRFYVALVPTVTLPFIFTGMFVHGGALLEGFSIPLAALAPAIALFSLGRGATSVLSGWAVDRTSGASVFAVAGLPVCLGLALFSLAPTGEMFWICISLGGIGLGLALNAGAAMWAELFGVAHLGAIRGVLSFLVVLSTAIAAPVLGALLDSGGAGLFMHSLLVLAVVSSVFAWIVPRLART